MISSNGRSGLDIENAPFLVFLRLLVAVYSLELREDIGDNIFFWIIKGVFSCSGFDSSSLTKRVLCVSFFLGLLKY